MSDLCSYLGLDDVPRDFTTIPTIVTNKLGQGIALHPKWAYTCQVTISMVVTK